MSSDPTPQDPDEQPVDDQTTEVVETEAPADDAVAAEDEAEETSAEDTVEVERPADRAAAKKTAAKKSAGNNENPGAAKAKKPASAAAAKKAADADDAPARRSGEFTVTTAGLVRAGLALLAIVAVVAIGLLSWQVVAKSRTLAAFDDSKAASEHFVKTYFPTMMAQGATEEQIKSEILPLTAGEAKERIELDAKTTVQWARDAGLANIEIAVGVVTVESFSADRATTLVTAEMSGTSAAAPGGGKQPFLLELDLVKDGGSWLVSRMTTVQGVSADPATGQTPPGQPQNPVPQNPVPQPTQQAPAEQPGG
ncbi:hypothetical protein C6V83_12555 [Gordonia iterans]|uniref:Uncharacterized protein n=1 Tax=Gordonia iterans TaxID=1004901 RepID=A0A2S0KH49_9ACTN|nr:hypothetical protein [Gordonia iterans]AVM00961.1 hypothetical protein C6V83_12555 [Gordonia iterans]